MSYMLNTYDSIKAWKRISEFAHAEVAEEMAGRYRNHATMDGKLTSFAADWTPIQLVLLRPFARLKSSHMVGTGKW